MATLIRKVTKNHKSNSIIGSITEQSHIFHIPNPIQIHLRNLEVLPTLKDRKNITHVNAQRKSLWQNRGIVLNPVEFI